MTHEAVEQARTTIQLEALITLDAILDFGQPVSDTHPIKIQRYERINGAFTKARAAIAKAGDGPSASLDR